MPGRGGLERGRVGEHRKVQRAEPRKHPFIRVETIIDTMIKDDSAAGNMQQTL
jgi:hypothetical protein